MTKRIERTVVLQPREEDVDFVARLYETLRRMKEEEPELLQQRPVREATTA